MLLYTINTFILAVENHMLVTGSHGLDISYSCIKPKHQRKPDKNNMIAHYNRILLNSCQQIFRCFNKRVV